jgi:dipeptidyl aminopeptidase/acylaminoacyl peptidase
MRTKIISTVLAAALLVSIAVLWAITRRGPDVDVDPELTLGSTGTLVRDTKTGHLALVTPDGRRRQSKAECSRGYTAGGRILCLHPDPEAAGTFQLSVLDDHFNPIHEVPINGVPTRTRVSADGRMMGYTVFVSGDSYLTSGFSTRSGILDLATEALASSLEDFAIDGRKPPTDANFWGISFAADDNTFYATMSTGTHLYLVQGDFAAETITVLDDGVECPSLSPDGNRLVYKKRLPDLTWQLWVYDLAAKSRTQLAEPGNVDDQGAWIDDQTIMYGKLDESDGSLSVWSVPADGTGTPTMIIPDAESPSAVR